MLGRPIGFDIRMGTGGFNDFSDPLLPVIEQPLALKIIYNECNCAASTFIGDNPPTDMAITIENSPTATQALTYQNNYIEYVYEQDCGRYEVVLENQDSSQPDINSILTVAEPDPRDGPNNLKYSDLITATTADPALVGQYVVDMVVRQNEPDNYHYEDVNNDNREMPEVRYPFTVTVNPCVVTFESTQTLVDWAYYLEDPTVSQTYAMTQTPSCYAETVTLTYTGSFLTHDELTSTITLT